MDASAAHRTNFARSDAMKILRDMAETLEADPRVVEIHRFPIRIAGNVQCSIGAIGRIGLNCVKVGTE